MSTLGRFLVPQPSRGLDDIHIKMNKGRRKNQPNQLHGITNRTDSLFSLRGQ